MKTQWCAELVTEVLDGTSAGPAADSNVEDAIKARLEEPVTGALVELFKHSLALAFVQRYVKGCDSNSFVHGLMSPIIVLCKREHQLIIERFFKVSPIIRRNKWSHPAYRYPNSSYARGALGIPGSWHTFLESNQRCLRCSICMPTNIFAAMGISIWNIWQTTPRKSAEIRSLDTAPPHQSFSAPVNNEHAPMFTKTLEIVLTYVLRNNPTHLLRSLMELIDHYVELTRAVDVLQRGLLRVHTKNVEFHQPTHCLDPCVEPWKKYLLSYIMTLPLICEPLIRGIPNGQDFHRQKITGRSTAFTREMIQKLTQCNIADLCVFESFTRLSEFKARESK